MKYKCPDPACPATDFEPAAVTAFEDQGQATAVCAQCSGTYPLREFRKIR